VGVGTGFKSRHAFARLFVEAGQTDVRIDTIFLDYGRKAAYVGIIKTPRARRYRAAC